MILTVSIGMYALPARINDLLAICAQPYFYLCVCVCFFQAANEEDKTVGAIVCKIDPHKRTMRSRGYIAMLAVDHDHRRKKIGE